MESLWDGLLRDWRRSLTARNLSESTLRIYTTAVRQLVDHLAATGGPGGPAGLTRAHLEDFIASMTATRSAATASVTYRALQQFARWLVEEGECARSPMELMRPPIVPEQPVPVLADDQLRALLRGTDGTDLVSRRDAAILRLFIDTGGRRGEIAGLRVEDVDLDQDVAHVLGKGRRGRALPFGTTTALALGRYLRVRARDRHAGRPELWLAEKGRGPLTAAGVQQMVERRGLAAGIPGLHPHQFRHTAAHRWLAADGNETDLQRIMGWRSPQMLRRYGASKADERAREAHRRLGLADRI